MRGPDMAIFQTIIVPLDGSHLAETAIPMATTLSQVTGAEIILLQVLEEMRPIYDAEYREVIWLDPANPRLELLAPEILKPAVTRLANQGVPVQTVIRLGDPSAEIIDEAVRHPVPAEIIDEAEHHPVPVIVLASHGRGGLRRMLLGSVATRLVEAAACPVLIIRSRNVSQEPEPVTLQSIAVPLDGSALAEQALAVAVPLAKAAGAELHLVRVVEIYQKELLTDTELLTMPIAKPTLELFERLENQSREYLTMTAERLEQESLQVTWEVLSGDPGRELLDYADRDRPDLMVITTHGRGGLSRWFYGSIADKVLTASEVPVLLIRAR